MELNQTSTLIELFKKDEALQKHYDLTDPDYVWSVLEKLTEKQYKYFLYLITNSKRTKLNQLMISVGFLPKNI